MKTKILGILAVGLLGGLLAVKSAEASLIGSTATCDELSSTPSFSCNVKTATVVDPGVEFRLLGAGGAYGAWDVWEVDIDADSLTIRYVVGEPLGLSRAGFRFGGLLAATGIINVSRFNTSNDIESNYSLSDGVLTADLSGRWTTDGWVRISFDFQTTSVPEPGALALLGLGLVGMGYARRRKAS